MKKEIKKKYLEFMKNNKIDILLKIVYLYHNNETYKFISIKDAFDCISRLYSTDLCKIKVIQQDGRIFDFFYFPEEVK